MNRTRLIIGLQLGLGLFCVGLGHYYTALFRTEYPLDGLVYYGVAAICFALAWRTARRQPNAVWSALTDLWRGARHEIRAVVGESWRSLQQATPYISNRLIVAAVVIVNVMAAMLIVLLPDMSGLWFMAWGGTLIALIVYLLPRSIFQKPITNVPVPAMMTAT